MTIQNQSEVGAIQLDGVSETLVASTESARVAAVVAELESAEPSAAELAAADRFLGGCVSTTTALMALHSVLRDLGAHGEADALLAALDGVIAAEAVSL